MTRPRRRLRWAAAATVVVALVAGLLLVPLPYYVESPGQLLPLAACVEVADVDDAALTGDYLVTTVSLLPATGFDIARGALAPDRKVVARDTIIPPGTTTPDFFAEQRGIFDTTADVAAAVGQTAAGLDAGVTGEGVRVVRVVPGSAAEGSVLAGDVIVAVDGRSVTTDRALREVVAASAGRVLVLTLVRDDQRVEVEVAPSTVEGRTLLGVEPLTVNPRVDLAVPVEVEAGRIGGPSAGLLIALTVYDKLVGQEDLASGRRIAGTGTIAEDGTVGPIGGIALKVIAADRADADVFLAPAAQLEEALSGVARGSDLVVLGVDDFPAARSALLRSAAQAPPPASGSRPQPCPVRS